jgi:predicted ABC-type exoprotein transport system permease subunit
MENLKKSKLLSTVIAIFTLTVCFLIATPIGLELDSLFASCLLLLITLVSFFIMGLSIEKKINEYIVSEIKRNKNKHIQEFFNYIEKDKQFSKNVLRKDIPILNDDNEEIGEQTVYIALNDKKYKFMR